MELLRVLVSPDKQDPQVVLHLVEPETPKFLPILMPRSLDPQP